MLTFAFWCSCTAGEGRLVWMAAELVLQIALGLGAVPPVQTGTDVEHVGALGCGIGQPEVNVLELEFIFLLVVLGLLLLVEDLPLVAIPDKRNRVCNKKGHMLTVHVGQYQKTTVHQATCLWYMTQETGHETRNATLTIGRATQLGHET